MALPGGFFLLLGSPGILHFDDFGGVGSALPTRIVDVFVADSMFGFEYDGENFLLEQAKANVKLVVIVTQGLGVNHLGSVDLLVFVVVLDESEDLGHRDVG